jgi:hypothetical protein
MPSNLLSRYTPVALAGILLGRSPSAVSKLIEQGKLDTIRMSGKRPWVSLSSVERLLGQEVSIQTYLVAERQLDPVREAARARQAA